MPTTRTLFIVCFFSSKSWSFFHSFSDYAEDRNDIWAQHSDTFDICDREDLREILVIRQFVNLIFDWFFHTLGISTFSEPDEFLYGEKWLAIQVRNKYFLG